MGQGVIDQRVGGSFPQTDQKVSMWGTWGIYKQGMYSNNQQFSIQNQFNQSLQLQFILLFDSMATATTATAPSSTRPSITSHKQLVRNVLTDEATIITWLQRRQLLSDSMTCSKCGEDCRLVARRGSFSWRCPTRGCQAFRSIRDKSFFSRSHLSLETIIELLYFWSIEVYTHH